MGYASEEPVIPKMKHGKIKKHLQQIDLPISDPADIFCREMFEPATEEEWAARAKLKKIDANDIVHEGGREGFIEFLNSTPTYLFHQSQSPIMKLSRLWALYPEMKQPIIQGLLRRGEIMNIVASPKAKKSYLGLNLAMSVISGGSFLGRFECTRGKTLVIDNELHPETINPRTKDVAEASNVPLFFAGDLIDYISLRGDLTDVFSLVSYLDDIRPKYYSLVILDALYRFYPPDFDENSNADMARLYNHLDVYANTLDSAFVVIHHTSKFSQSGKQVTDVGAGAGSLTRACDSHMIIRPLDPDDDENKTVRIDAVTRSFPPVRPFCATFKYPIWVFNPDADPNDIKIDKPGAGRSAQAAEAKVPIEAYLSTEIEKPSSINEIIIQGASKNFSPWSRGSVRTIIFQLVKDGKMRQVDGASGAKAATYMSVNITPNTSKQDTPQPPSEQLESDGEFDADGADTFDSQE